LICAAERRTVLLSEKNVVRGVRVERRIKVNQVDAGIRKVSAQNI